MASRTAQSQMRIPARARPKMEGDERSQRSFTFATNSTLPSQIVLTPSVHSEKAQRRRAPPPPPPRRRSPTLPDAVASHVVASHPVADQAVANHADANHVSANNVGANNASANNASATHGRSLSGFGFRNRSETRPDGLCEPCSKIHFQGESSKETYMHALRDMLQKRHNCRFCGLLFQVLSLPENDPLVDGEIQASIQSDRTFQAKGDREAGRPVSFTTWAEKREGIQKIRMKKEAKWPFGHTHGNINITEDEEGSVESDEDAENGAAKLGVDYREGGDPNRAEMHALRESSRVGLAAGQHFDDNQDRRKAWGFLGQVLPDSDFLDRMLKKKMPVGLRIVVFGPSHEKSGIIQVTLFGASRAIGREIRALSHFHLRVATSELTVGESQDLRYTRILKSRIDLKLCRLWVEHCESRHGEKCNTPGWSSNLAKPFGIKFRLIDVIDKTLVEVDPSRCEYAALSYVWGPLESRTHLTQLSRGTARELFVPNGLENVGRTIEDAMQIVRGLGLRYLWADRLCIMQDDAADLASQIAQMDRIYGSAVVTITAATAEHLNAGISGIGSNRSIHQLAERVRGDSDVNVLLPIRSQTDLLPWAARAWTLQEKLLSRRLLVFHHGVVDFHCACGVMHEDMSAADAGSNPTPIGWLAVSDNRLASSVMSRGHRRGPRLLRSPVFSEYAALIEQYTPRQMSNPADAVHAVSGMLKILITNQQSGRPKPLLYGLPQEFFDQAFHWQCAAGDDVRLRLRSDRRDNVQSGARFPTWSWAAWEAVDGSGSDGGVRYEVPFQVHTHRGSLRKVIMERNKEDADERMRPLLRWYLYTDQDLNTPSPPKLPPRRGTGPPPRPARRPGEGSPTSSYRRFASLQPLNQSGLGFMLNKDVSIAGWVDSVRDSLDGMDQPQPSLPADTMERLREGHLVFKTSIARFRLGATRTRMEDLCKLDRTGDLAVERTLQIRETFILDKSGQEVGRVVLPDPDAHQQDDRWHNFILISEAQYFGDERYVDVGEYPLFNIMLVEWEGRPFATRLAMGKIAKDAWWAADTVKDFVVLG